LVTPASADPMRRLMSGDRPWARERPQPGHIGRPPWATRG
jgi:hypothetical protein